MSTSVIEPGTRLADRYRLDERFSESEGSTLWKATDEILARAVAVRTFVPDFPRIAEVVTAARSASRLTDPRLTQVFDADDSGLSQGLPAYVVSEWVTGETLEEMVATGGPMEPGRAATFLYEAAQALTAAHAVGLFHLRLTARDLLWTTGNTVKILGLGVDAALAGVTAENPAATDTRGLALMLYAALTGRWPGVDERGRLPAAPERDGLPPRPSELRPGLPHSLDLLAGRALGLEGDPIDSPAALAQALQRVPRTPMPIFSGLTQELSTPPSVVPRPAAQQAPPGYGGGRQAPMTQQQQQPMMTQPSYQPAAPAAPAANRRALLGIAAAAIAVILVVTVWAVSKGNGGGNARNGVTGTNPNGGSTAQADAKLDPAGASGFDPLDPDHPDTAVTSGAKSVINGSGDWHTQTYTSAKFGKLKHGLGLLIKLAAGSQVSKVTVTMPGGSAGTVELRVGDDSSSLQGLPKVASSNNAIGTFTLTTAKPVSGGYVLLWFTKLPTIGGQFIAQVNKVTVYGKQG